jgi:hypothetical protein
LFFKYFVHINFRSSNQHIWLYIESAQDIFLFGWRPESVRLFFWGPQAYAL